MSFCNICHCLFEADVNCYAPDFVTKPKEDKRLKTDFQVLEGKVICNAVGGVKCKSEEGNRVGAKDVCISGISEGRAEKHYDRGCSCKGGV